ncbi:MAG: hypothetical protein LBO63_08955 [Oscillospiraceae bacterium]|jgi:hypothetical protein|nr:hypothetical protein [Oscillospiraceae bacterium]
MSLLDSFENSEFPVAVYNDRENSNRFRVGFVDAVSEKYFILNRISYLGYENGFLLGLVDDVFRVECNTMDINKDLLLWKLHGQTKSADITPKDNLLTALFEAAESHNYIISINVFDEGIEPVEGFVSEFDDEQVVINNVDYCGNADGISLVALADIALIIANSYSQRILKELYFAKLGAGGV